MTPYQKIPKVDRILEHPGVVGLLGQHARAVVIAAIRTVLDEVRSAIAAQPATPPTIGLDEIAARVAAEIALMTRPLLRRVVNGTGVVIHTNLGRSPLPPSLEKRLAEVASGYTNLEFDLARGSRGTRYAHVEPLLCEITGAEAALVVNNNAAAVMLALSSLAAGREVVVSRGELVEIGGSFRIPDVMRMSGALLREVGTTNRTHIHDYRNAITHETALLLKVHTSNFAVVGFTAEVAPEELATVGRNADIPVMADAGSGSLVDLSPYGIAGEPTVQEFVRAGIDVITFSGDKMLGAAQAGIIVGKSRWIEPMKKHPLLRAFRVDKLTLAALEGVLALYRDERRALAEIPTLRMLTLSAEDLRGRALALRRRLMRTLPGMSVGIRSDFSQVGGGAHPLLQLPTTTLVISFAGMSASSLEKRLRSTSTPVIGRISRDDFLLDVRTILDEDIPLLLASLAEVSESASSPE